MSFKIIIFPFSFYVVNSILNFQNRFYSNFNLRFFENGEKGTLLKRPVFY